MPFPQCLTHHVAVSLTTPNRYRVINSATQMVVARELTLEETCLRLLELAREDRQFELMNGVVA